MTFLRSGNEKMPFYGDLMSFWARNRRLSLGYFGLFWPLEGLETSELRCLVFGFCEVYQEVCFYDDIDDAYFFYKVKQTNATGWKRRPWPMRFCSWRFSLRGPGNILYILCIIVIYHQVNRLRSDYVPPTQRYSDVTVLGFVPGRKNVGRCQENTKGEKVRSFG